MRVFFINEINKYDSIGIECLSSFIKQHGFEARVFLVPDLVYNTTITLKWLRFFKGFTMINDEDFMKFILSQNPDVLCFSAVTDYFQRARQLAKIAKRLKPDIIIVIGGAHCTVSTEYVLKFSEFDYVCKGEGENALLKLLTELRNKNYTPTIPGIYYRNNNSIAGSGIGEIIENLDDLPFLDKDDVFRDYPFLERIYFINTLRGCIFNCTYCGSPASRDEYKKKGINIIRRKSVDSVIRELSYGKKRFRKMQFVGFADDVFTYPLSWARDFAKEYKKHVGLPFFMCTNPVLFKDEDLIRQLKQAGLLYVEIGVQAVDENYRLKQVKRPDSDKDIFASASLMKKYNIYFQVNHIFGLDRRDLVDENFLKETVGYYMKLKPNRTHCFELEFLPGTEETEMALEEKRISNDIYKKIFDGDISCAYNFGGSIKEHMIFTPYVVFLELIPFLPQSISKIIFKNEFLFSFIKKIPFAYIVLARILNTAIFDRRDIEGSPHYKKYIDGVRYILKVKRQLRCLSY